MESQTQASVSRLLSNELLHRVERMRVVSMLKRTSRSHGEHLSGRGGSSTEFADYRDYVAGDDLRYVDWNTFARLRRPYLKLFHLEEEQHLVILLDASTSMKFEGKAELAKGLAACFGVMGLMGGERVSMYAFNENRAEPRAMPPTSGRPSLRRMLAFVESIEPGGDQPLEKGLEAALKVHRGRGILVMLSDFLTFGDLRRAMNFAASAGLEPLALQVLSPTEMDPDVAGDLRLVDSENESTLDITPGGTLLNVYREYRDAYQGHVELLAKQRGGRHVCVESDTPLQRVVMDVLRRRGWVR